MKRTRAMGGADVSQQGKRRLVIGISGASGVVIGLRLVSELCSRGHEVHVIVSEAAEKVIRHETGGPCRLPARAFRHGPKDADSSLNSSSFVVDAVAIVPCSMKTLSAVASGYADNLLVRAAETALRTGRRLVVVPRETPLSLSALENMAALKRGGAVIMPPCAAYYHHPRSVGDMTDFFVGKILDALGIENGLYGRWNVR